MYDTGQLRVQFNTMTCVVCKNLFAKFNTQCRTTNVNGEHIALIRNGNNNKCILIRCTQQSRRDIKNINTLERMLEKAAKILYGFSE